jgi:hypothetical protein
MENSLMMNTVAETSFTLYYAIGTIVLVLLSIGAYVTYQQWAASPWFSDRYWASENLWSWWNPPAISLTELGVLHQVETPAPVPGAAATVSTSEREDLKESWCFVGEDLTGRFCVKVPSDASCDKDRLFGSEKDCELTPANHLPAGIIKENGTAMRPLSDMRFR